MCTTQVCTAASGHVSRIDSGRPFNPSQHTINASATPRVFNSVSIVAHCLAASPPVGPSRAPDVAFAGEVHADRDVDGPTRDLGVADLDHDCVDQDHRIDRVERRVLPPSMSPTIRQ